ERLRDNLEGLDWLVDQLNGRPAGPRPKPRTYAPPPAKESSGPAYSPEFVARLARAAKTSGDARHGALVFHAPQFACIGCHKLGTRGGIVGPDLSAVGRCLTPE